MSRIIWAFQQDDKAAPSELAELAIEISTLRLILQRLEESDAAEDGGRRIWEAKDIAVTLNNCNDVVAAARTKVETCEKLLRGGALDRFHLAFSSSSLRQDFKDLLARIERSKTSLLLSLQLINL